MFVCCHHYEEDITKLRADTDTNHGNISENIGVSETKTSFRIISLEKRTVREHESGIAEATFEEFMAWFVYICMYIRVNICVNE